MRGFGILEGRIYGWHWGLKCVKSRMEKMVGEWKGWEGEAFGGHDFMS